MLRRQQVELRNALRKRVLKGGFIAFSARHATLPCVVRDISASGARLQVEQATTVPDTFELIVELDGFEAPCVVVWRRATEVGVTFLSTPAKVMPKRQQVVGVTSPINKATLRRTPSILASAPANVITVAPVSAPVVRPPATTPQASIPILIADDDPDDRMLIEDAFRESHFSHPFEFVENGEELLKYLRAEGPYGNRLLPGLVLLDLNMPRMDGRTALMHLKTDAALRRIPVIVLTTSNAEEDIARTYDLGISGYIAKPSTVEGLMDLVQSLNQYWLRFVSLPQPAA